MDSPTPLSDSTRLSLVPRTT